MTRTDKGTTTGSRHRTAKERNESARKLVAEYSREIVIEVLQPSTLAALEQKLHDLHAVASAEGASKGTKKAYLTLYNLLYGGPLPFPFDDERTEAKIPVLHTWGGLAGLVEQGKEEGVATVVDQPLRAEVVIELLKKAKAKLLMDDAKALAKTLTSYRAGTDLFFFSKPICDRLNRTSVERIDDQPLSALAFVADSVERHIPKPPDQRHVIGVAGKKKDILTTREPALLDYSLQSPGEVIAMESEGKPFAGLSPGTRLYRRARIGSGQLRLLPGPKSIGGREVGDVVIRSLIDLELDNERSALRCDVARLATFGFALSGTVELPEGLGAYFLTGRTTPESIARFWRATHALRTLTVRVDVLGRWADLASVTADPNARVVHLGPPAWWRGRGAWRLSGRVFRYVADEASVSTGRARLPPALERTIAGLETRLWWGPTAGRGRGGRIPDTLRPVRQGGPGPSVFVHWQAVLTLSGEHVEPTADARSSAAGKRYRRRIAALEAAKYFVGEGGSAAEAGDTVEIVRVQRGGLSRPAGIWIRASARLCAAVRDRNWTRVAVGQVLGRQ